jgi:hypothetical protein
MLRYNADAPCASALDLDHKSAPHVTKADNSKRFKNGCCSARALCPAHRLIAAKWQAERRDSGIKPYSFTNERAADLMRLAPTTLPDTAESRAQLVAVANYMTGEPKRFKAWLAKAAPWYFEDDADELLGRLACKPLRYGSAKLAQMFNVTWEWKQDLGIKTIAALDTPADVIATRKESKRQRDRRYRHDQRRRLGMTPQTESASRLKPWKAVGMSRAQWYRRGKPTPECHETTLSSLNSSSTRDDKTVRVVAKPRRSRPKHPKTPGFQPKTRRKRLAPSPEATLTRRLSHHPSGAGSGSAEPSPKPRRQPKRRLTSADSVEHRTTPKRQRQRPSSITTSPTRSASGSTPRGSDQALRSIHPAHLPRANNKHREASP